jgi:hypothetical protein
VAWTEGRNAIACGRVVSAGAVQPAHVTERPVTRGE